MGYTLLSYVLFFLLSQLDFSSSIPHMSPKHQCLALQKFNKTLTIDQTSRPVELLKTSRWNMSRDCCLWDGVICDESTGHVIELHLDFCGLVGKIDSNSSLFQLSNLQWLDLSWNNFSYSQISPEFGNFPSLTHLDLSESYFSGQIPSEISHLSKLQSLFLSARHNLSARVYHNLGLTPNDFKMLLQNLTQLRELHLVGVNISSTIPPNISSHITELSLGSTGLYGIVPHHIFHLPNLKALDLSYNDKLSACFPKTKWNSSASLMYLYLNRVEIYGGLPESLGYLTSLQDLSLEDCSLSGSIPSGIFSHLSLRSLNLGFNQLQGPLPNSIQNHVNLDSLDLSSNNFSGKLDVSVFSNLTRLYSLYLSHNRISLTNEKKVKVTLPESLMEIYLAGCDVRELEFLRSVKYLDTLDLSNNKIQGRIPDWAWSNWMYSLQYLNLSHNMLTSVKSIPLQFIYTIDLRSNSLQGSLPIPHNSTTYFFMSNNSLSGEIPVSICNSTSLMIIDLAKNNLTGEIPLCLGNLGFLEVLTVSHNNLSEEIPSSVCSLTSMQILDLGRNNLKGEIPQCFGNMSGHLQVLDMQYNRLFGILPTTYSNGSVLRSINLRGNNLHGKFPQYLANCKELQVLDLGDNHLNDTFPMWLGNLQNLKVLSLRSNKLHGYLRTSKIGNMFPSLRILDVSHNAFTGNLPMSLFKDLKAMKIMNQTMKGPSYLGDEYYQDSVVVANKGLELELVRILTVYTTIDLSSNCFEGNIPSIVGDLVALRTLNLSHNGLQGHIPPSLGNLSFVESLDLSDNQLSGEIPKQLASITSLEVLNLSYNHFEGCIPRGPQFDTFENTSYEGNDGLRGFPLSKGCGKDRSSETNSTAFALEDEGSDSEFLAEFWKAALVGCGTGLGIGVSIVYFIMSRGYPLWLARLIVQLEHKIFTRRRKKQRNQRNSGGSRKRRH